MVAFSLPRLDMNRSDARPCRRMRVPSFPPPRVRALHWEHVASLRACPSLAPRHCMSFVGSTLCHCMPFVGGTSRRCVPFIGGMSRHCIPGPARGLSPPNCLPSIPLLAGMAHPHSVFPPSWARHIPPACLVAPSSSPALCIPSPCVPLVLFASRCVSPP